MLIMTLLLTSANWLWSNWRRADHRKNAP